MAEGPEGEAAVGMFQDGAQGQVPGLMGWQQASQFKVGLQTEAARLPMADQGQMGDGRLFGDTLPIAA